MSSEKLDPKKNPWAHAAISEAELGPEEVTRIRSEVQKRMTGSSEHAVVSSKESIRDEFIENFRDTLIEAGGTFTHVYHVDASGHILFEENQGALDPAFYLSILASEGGEEDISGGSRETTTPDSMRNAARLISEKHPDIVFEFDESDERDVLMCSAKITDTPKADLNEPE